MLPLEDGLQVSDIHVSCVEDATAAALSRICTEQGLHDTALFHVPSVTDPVLVLVLPAGSRAHRTPSCQARGQDTRIPGHRAYNSGPAAPGRVNVVGIPQCWWGGFARHVPCHSSPPTVQTGLPNPQLTGTNIHMTARQPACTASWAYRAGIRP